MSDNNWVQRYSRQIMLTGFGAEAQEKLGQSSVLVVGCGGLGCPVLLYLTAMGVGQITLIDDDRVEWSNLPRQVLFAESDLGRYKAEAAAERLRPLHGNVILKPIVHRVHSGNVRQLVRSHDVVVDASDNFPTRFLLNDACVLEDKVLVHGAAGGYDGQVASFNVPLSDGSRGPNYRDLFPVSEDPNVVPSCSEAGVLGVLPGIIGELQALEVVKYLCGIGRMLTGELLLFDALSSQFSKIRYFRNPLVRIAESDLPITSNLFTMSWEKWRSEFKPLTRELIDVRESDELERFAAGSVHRPLSDAQNWMRELIAGETYAFYCESGRRSAGLIDRIAREGFEGVLIQIEGGMKSYQEL